MTAPRINALSIKGFRAFGATEQTLNLKSDITVVWGQNSKGKTSLGEAFEFLLTGRIARRELMASCKDEFADALRNTYLSSEDDVYVRASIKASDGSEHEIKRVLTSDYTKRDDCTSKLYIDGSEATEADIEKLGIALSHPPFRAPILAQHTLSHIFSIGPKKRADYFKNILEVDDLDELRDEVISLKDDLKLTEDPLVEIYERVKNIAALSSIFDSITDDVPLLTTLEAKFKEAAALIGNELEEMPETLDERLTIIEGLLEDRRAKVFPVQGFEREELAGWNPPAGDIWSNLDTYLEELEKVEEETRELISFFEEALKLPLISEIAEPVDCPLCGTKSALTQERVELIRGNIEGAAQYNQAYKKAQSSLGTLITLAQSLTSSTEKAIPKCFRMKYAELRKIGFTISKLKEIMGDEGLDLIEAWHRQGKAMSKAGSKVYNEARKSKEIAESQNEDTASNIELNVLRSLFATLEELREEFVRAINMYIVSEQSFVEALNEILDTQADTTGWQEFIDIARQLSELRNALVERASKARVLGELETAIDQIDTGKGKVLNDKFLEYSDLIYAWWERLRPDETTFFSSVNLRKGATRTIDFKAGLSADGERNEAELRDVIAVFSHSQLHCLGLALFLARAQREELGFIILDDPVLSSDDDYSFHFVLTVLTELLSLPIQVIILTQNYGTSSEIETRYMHESVSIAQLLAENPPDGCVIDNTGDTILARIEKAKILSNDGHPELLKDCGRRLREVGEQICKRLLVDSERRNGNEDARLSDYDELSLDSLCKLVTPLLFKDKSHASRLRAFKDTVNRACHDNPPPSNERMKHACVEIKMFYKSYLI